MPDVTATLASRTSPTPQLYLPGWTPPASTCLSRRRWLLSAAPGLPHTHRGGSQHLLAFPRFLPPGIYIYFLLQYLFYKGKGQALKCGVPLSCLLQWYMNLLLPHFLHSCIALTPALMGHPLISIPLPWGCSALSSPWRRAAPPLGTCNTSSEHWEAALQPRASPSHHQRVAPCLGCGLWLLGGAAIPM